MSTPIQTKQASAIIQQQHTEILVQHYSDRVFILITQLNGKVGALYDIQSSPSTLPSRRHTLNGLDLPVPDQTARVSTLMGSAKNEAMADLHSLYAAQIASIVNAKSVVLGLGLKESSGMQNDRECFAECVGLVVGCL